MIFLLLFMATVLLREIPSLSLVGVLLALSCVFSCMKLSEGTCLTKYFVVVTGLKNVTQMKTSFGLLMRIFVTWMELRGASISS
jgi:hypothetical protein